MKSKHWNVQDGDDVVGLWFPDGIYRQGKVMIDVVTQSLYLNQPKEKESFFAIDDAYAIYKLATK